MVGDDGFPVWEIAKTYACAALKGFALVDTPKGWLWRKGSIELLEEPPTALDKEFMLDEDKALLDDVEAAKGIVL